MPADRVPGRAAGVGEAARRHRGPRPDPGAAGSGGRGSLHHARPAQGGRRAGGHAAGQVRDRSVRVLDRTIGATIRQQLGLDQARVLVTAAAPIHPDLIRWFHAIGLPMLELYGQTEGCGAGTGNRADHIRIGTVGTALPGMSVRIADDGEILVKGGNVCLGYLNDPEATAELIDADGWMHTGDTGAFDADGSLRIVGRKKDLIITAAGKNIAPQDIETDLRNLPLVSEAIVVGEGRRVPRRPAHPRPRGAHPLGAGAQQAWRARIPGRRPRPTRRDPGGH